MIWKDIQQMWREDKLDFLWGVAQAATVVFCFWAVVCVIAACARSGQ